MLKGKDLCRRSKEIQEVQSMKLSRGRHESQDRSGRVWIEESSSESVPKEQVWRERETHRNLEIQIRNSACILPAACSLEVSFPGVKDLGLSFLPFICVALPRPFPSQVLCSRAGASGAVLG